MAKEIPSTFVIPSLSEIALNEPIKSIQYGALNSASNLLFSRKGILTPGKTAIGSTPLWITEDTSYTQVGISGSQDRDALQSWHGVLRGWRYIGDAQPLRLTYFVYGAGVDFRFTLRSLDPTSSLTASATVGCDAEGWYAAQIGFSLAQATIGGAGVTPKPMGVYVTARVRASYSEARVWSWGVRERILLPGNEVLLP